MYTRQGMILVGLTVTLLGLSGLLGYGPLAGAITPTTVDWSTLHGVNYGYVYRYAGDPGPSYSFPLMVARNVNFIHVYFDWYQLDQNPSAYLAKIDQIASAADVYGIQVIYGFFCSFPSWITTSYGGGDGCFKSNSSCTFLTPWWQNQVTVSGQNGWQLMIQNVWAPMITHVDSHPSTLGYELFTEPPLCSAPITAMQAHNQFFAAQIRALSPSKTIVFMGAGSDGFFYDPNNIPAVAPTISNIGVDVHSYDDYAGEPGRVASWVTVAKTVPGVGGQVIVGEYGPTSYNRAWADMPTAQAYLTTHLASFKSLGAGNAAWIWGYGTTGYLILLDATGKPWWYTDMIGTTIASVYGIVTTTTTATTMTTSTTTTSSSTATTTSSSTSTTTSTSSTSSTTSTTTTGCTVNCKPTPFPLLASITTVVGAGVTFIGFRRKEDG